METRNMTVGELRELLAVPESGTAREQIVYIDVYDLEPDPRNFYSLSDIEGLMENISLFGIQQPLRVRADPMDPDRWIIVSGHRRREAVRRLAEDGREDLREVPCIIESAAGSEALQELRLIYANSDTRRMTSAEISSQAERVEALLYQLKEEGFDFPGRMRDHVAEACKVSKSKLARLKVIREGLNSEWLTLWEAGKVPEETAYQLARLSEEGQSLALMTAKKKSRLEYFYASTAENVGKGLKELDEKCPTCPKARPQRPCPHLAEMKRKTAEEDLWYMNPCAGTCCIDCWKLYDCKDICRHAEPEKKRRKEERKEAIARRKKEEAQREAPLIEINKTLWARFAQARKEAGKSVEECFSAMGRYMHAHSTEDFEKAEADQKARKDVNESPFGYMLSPANVRDICAVADLLGVSLDYLFGRTDEP